MGQNEELVMRIQDGELYLMGKLWEANQGLVKYIAGRYRESCGCLFDFDDLMQAGYLGLHAAAMIYTTERGASFATYAVFHIRRAMREVAGLRGKREAIFDARPLDAPMGDDGDDTLLDLIPAPWEDYPIELEELRHIVRVAVSQIGDRKAREAIQAVYRDGVTLADYARSEGISAQGAGERLQRGYAILRKNPSIIALALAEGYDTEYFRYKGLGAYRRVGVSAVEDAVKATERRLYALPILREKLERDKERLSTLDGAARTDLEAAIAADADEVETLERALAKCAGDAYYQTVAGRYFDGLDDAEIGKLLHSDVSTVWRNRKRLVQRISVYLYGAFAVR